MDKKDYPQSLNLFLTGKCNLDCRYCFVNKEGIGKKTLSLAQIKKSIDALFKYPGKKKTIAFSGGEPTIEFDLIKEVYSYARQKADEKKIVLDVSIVTNGTLLDQDKVDFFRKNKFIVKISLDGDRKTHDANRPFVQKKGASSFDRVMENLHNIDRHDLKLAASMVVVPESASELLKNIKRLQAEDFYYIEFYPDLYATWTPKQIKNFEKSLAEFSKFYKTTLKNKKSFKNSLLDSFTNDIGLGRMNNCGKINVGPQGGFYVCDKALSLNGKTKEKYLVGKMDVEKINDEKRKRILNRLRKGFFETVGQKCLECSYKDYCFCPLGNQIYFKENGGDYFDSFCSISKAYIKNFLKLKKDLKYNPSFINLYKF